ncbi:MAG TPA: histidine kinase, partial [Actinomycetota bacterium]
MEMLKPADRAGAQRVSETTTRRVVRAVLILVALGIVAEIALDIRVGKDPDNGWVGTIFFIVGAMAQVGLLTLGWLILTRQHANRMGWLFIGLAFAAELWMFSGSYASYAYLRHQGPMPFERLSAWVNHWSLGVLLLMFVPLFLLFPNGRAVSPRWRWLTWAWVGATTVSAIGWASSPAPIVIGGSPNAVRIASPVSVGPWIDTVTAIAGAIGFASAIGALVSLIVRYRRAGPEERQQIRWIRAVGVAFFVVFGFNLLVLAFSPIIGQDVANTIGNYLFLVVAAILVIGLPFAAGIAVLKYRLYDLDVVVKKALVFGVLAVFISGVYALVVGGIGAIVGSRSNAVLSFAAAAVLALAFQPVRERARRFADRLVYGKRATPYEVLADFSDRMAETYATEDVLPRMASILAEGTGAEVARVWLNVAGELRPVASSDGSNDAKTRRVDTGIDVPGEHAVEVRHQGELLGALSVRMPPSDPMNPSKDELVRDLAAQAGLVLRNVRLISDLRASRQRLVAAQDEERRKLERNLHDGAQQQLVALAVKLRLVEQLAARDAEKAREMIS